MKHCRCYFKPVTQDTKRPAKKIAGRLSDKLKLKPLLVLICHLVAGVVNSAEQSLAWVESRTEALELAENQGKKILLFAGRFDCAECDYMHNIACEYSEPAVRALIQSEYVPWFCNIDFSNDWKQYAAGLASFPLPLICTIHPTNSAAYMDRSVSIQSPKTFYSRLLTMAGVQLTNARLSSISLSNGVATIRVDHLTFGATNQLEQRFETQLPEQWTAITNFVSHSRTGSLAAPLQQGSKSAYYRIRSTQ